MHFHHKEAYVGSIPIGDTMNDLNTKIDSWNHEKECEDYLKEAAYYLWLDAGRPEGDGKEFWYKAEKIIKEN